MGSPDLTLAECCERWGVTSRNSVKARAAALGVELRRESSTRTVWPRDDVPLGDELDQHLRDGGTMRDFPGALPQPDAITSSKTASVTAPAGGSDAMMVAVLQLLQQQAQTAPPAPLARARALAAAADERLPLTTPELAELLGIDGDEVARLRAGSVIYGFKLARIGTRTTGPDRRAWILSRVSDGAADELGTVTAGSVVTAPTPLSEPMTVRRQPGFVACLDVTATPLARLQLPSW